MMSCSRFEDLDAIAMVGHMIRPQQQLRMNADQQFVRDLLLFLR